jgi:hypothetical protein
MGIVLKSRYEAVGREMGPTGRMKLAMITKISSVKAAEVEDSLENLKLFDDAVAQIQKEM